MYVCRYMYISISTQSLLERYLKFVMKKQLPVLRALYLMAIINICRTQTEQHQQQVIQQQKPTTITIMLKKKQGGLAQKQDYDQKQNVPKKIKQKKQPRVCYRKKCE